MAEYKKNNNNDDKDYIEKLVNIRRVVKVVKGGRIFGFSALVVVGDGNGKVGYGTGKAREVPVAIQKAMDKARKRMKSVSLVNGTLHYPIVSSVGAAKVYMQPASEGTGVIAGGPMRSVLEAVGVHNILAKCNGTRNPISVVRATVEGLTSMSSPQLVAAKRGKTVDQITRKG
ncbi:30S ribosomal protein S5 [Candidatus Ruthturnera calyptogenae]|uniref:Small ribosomal subunit protein uS5 n=2 Tax=Gammaproteobacteria incertae sedis TaxID=118884 RepID=RS5_RUTMC|nr:30S ribosomal protein S5 [Candidatus Ruthturnera calyptogenae]A1AVL7.1 RecName: Full=Small ribosomal subunit protein uS5; AltName: Full=30S ribosomal protein S5 [Candidatus Ruthia magnifica str. Cm (Calyptogena magnifica)]ABL01974.1 SSU ribosomal protein S5P [Candidatus Ruthia magnifica str. Cm (Calyptogena magnifica)]OOZ36431.1 30S ribosomal protein S5 [Solemya elarraichensis gill symbiont]